MGTQGLMPWAHKGRCTAAWQAQLMTATNAEKLSLFNLRTFTMYNLLHNLQKAYYLIHLNPNSDRMFLIVSSMPGFSFWKSFSSLRAFGKM